jgi:hypothetical protein
VQARPGSWVGWRRRTLRAGGAAARDDPAAVKN